MSNADTLKQRRGTVNAISRNHQTKINTYQQGDKRKLLISITNGERKRAQRETANTRNRLRALHPLDSGEDDTLDQSQAAARGLAINIIAASPPVRKKFIARKLGVDQYAEIERSQRGRHLDDDYTPGPSLKTSSMNDYNSSVVLNRRKPKKPLPLGPMQMLSETASAEVGRFRSATRPVTSLNNLNEEALNSYRILDQYDENAKKESKKQLGQLRRSLNSIKDT